MAKAERAPGRATDVVRGRRLSAEARRRHLLDAAAALLLDEGPGAFTMERLAERAGVSKGLGYAYFRDAEDVALSLWDREVAEVYRRVEDATAGGVSFEDALHAAVSAYFDVVAQRGALLGALQGHFGGSRAERRIRRRVIAFLRFWSERIQRAYALDPPVAATLAGMMLSAVEAGAKSWSAGVIDRAVAESLCLAFVTAGLSRPAGTREGRRRAR